MAVPLVASPPDRGAGGVLPVSPPAGRIAATGRCPREDRRKMHQDARLLPLETPPPAERLFTSDPVEAVDRLIALHDRAVAFLRDHFIACLSGQPPRARYRAFYPEVRLTTTSHARIDTRLAFGHVTAPG